MTDKTKTSYDAVLRGMRISERKARLVVALVRGRNVSEALDILRVTTKKTAPVLTKIINSAIANAKNTATVDVDRLYIAEAFVDGAGMMKRFMPRAQGRAFTIRKRTAHITIKLRER